MRNMSDYKNARMIALTLYEKEYSESGDVEVAIQKATSTAVGLFSGVDKEALLDDLRTSINIQIGKSTTLVDEDPGHLPWLKEAKTEINWELWERYRRYLLHEKAWSPEVVRNLDNTTDEILELLEDPRKRDRPFDRKGLVVGYVQSGKTANFTGLINKAIDAGYKLVIVLGGIHNSLRSQTQMRLDEEVLGFETSRKMSVSDEELESRRIGVSRLIGEKFVNIGFLTSRDEKGDFSRKIARTISIQPGDVPFLLVVKKNATVLNNVLNYFRNDSPLASKSPDVPYKTVKNVPFLLIDDEADQASVNTGDLVDEDGKFISDYDPTKINRLIRELYVTFEQRTYVGYTATPFANIFAHDSAEHSKYGAELFPSSFIISLPKPSNYFGPTEVFGLGEDTPGHPVVRVVTDGERLVIDNHKKDFRPAVVPDSLRTAIYSFLISTAIRRVRGQTKVHNSMLVHVTRFTAVQKKIKDLVEEEKDRIRRAIRYGEGSSSVLNKLHRVWVEDYVPTTSFMRPEEPQESWERISSEFLHVIESIKVKEINGSAGDILDYKEHKADGLNVIVVGGDKLSRGLTLEGLTVSYYLRNSKMYDTLMQMGRWFGYRLGYEDLCRIYTTEDLISWFQHIAVATEELREEVERMANAKATPADFGLRVRSHPTMLVTSQLKMKSGTQVKISYDGTLTETTIFDKDPNVLDLNFSVADGFVRLLGKPVENYLQLSGRNGGDSTHYVWTNVAGERVAEFLEQYSTHTNAIRANTKLIAQYIRKQMQTHDELTDWTFVMISLRTPYEPGKIEVVGGYNVNCVRRDFRTNDETLAFRRLITPDHEFLDFSKQQLQVIKQLSDGDKISNASIREHRSKKKGVLLMYPLSRSAYGLEQAPIGIAVSFPNSESAEKVSYVVNNVYMENDFVNA